MLLLSNQDKIILDTQCLPFDLEFTGLLVTGTKIPSVVFGLANDYIMTEGKFTPNFE